MCERSETTTAYPRRPVGQLETPARKKWIGADEKRVGPLAPNCRERRIDLATRAGIHDLDLQQPFRHLST
jgi:hypothetical protein